MRKIKKTSVVFFALVMAMVANFSVAMAYSYDFTLVRAVGVNTAAVKKDAVVKYGFVSVLSSSAPSYTTDYAIVKENSQTALTNFVRVLNQRGEGGKMFYDNPKYSEKVRMMGIDDTLKAPNNTHVTGLWSPNTTINH